MYYVVVPHGKQILNLVSGHGAVDDVAVTDVEVEDAVDDVAISDVVGVPDVVSVPDVVGVENGDLFSSASTFLCPLVSGPEDLCNDCTWDSNGHYGDGDDDNEGSCDDISDNYEDKYNLSLMTNII